MHRIVNSQNKQKWNRWVIWEFYNCYWRITFNTILLYHAFCLSAIFYLFEFNKKWIYHFSDVAASMGEGVHDLQICFIRGGQNLVESIKVNYCQKQGRRGNSQTTGLALIESTPLPGIWKRSPTLPDRVCRWNLSYWGLVRLKTMQGPHLCCVTRVDWAPVYCHHCMWQEMNGLSAEESKNQDCCVLWE